MTIEEARKRWGISEKRMLELLSNGIISGIRIEDGMLVMPDHNGIVMPRANQNITCESVAKMILAACDKLYYTDHRLLSVKKEDFSAILHQLEQCGWIAAKVPKKGDDRSNQNYICTPAGKEALKKRKLELVGLEVNLGSKFAGFTIKLGR